MTTPPDERRVRQLSPDQFPLLAASLGDSPETAIAHYLLTSRTCHAWAVGDPRQPRATIIQADAFPAEPSAFGWSGEDMTRILPVINDWACLDVPAHLLPILERPVATLAGTDRLRTLDDVYLILDQAPPTDVRRDAVRLLTDADALLLAQLDEQLPTGAQRPIIAAAIAENEILSVAHTFAWSPGYVDIGVTTHESARNLGYATAAAAIVCHEVRRRGKVPLWSTSGTNAAALRVAEKLGFREVSRRLYLIPEGGARS